MWTLWFYIHFNHTADNWYEVHLSRNDHLTKAWNPAPNAAQDQTNTKMDFVDILK